MLNKKELAAHIRHHVVTTLTVRDSEAAVEGIFDKIVSSMVAGEIVRVFDFGTFGTRQRQAQTGRNPQTGEKIQIPAKRVPAFTASKALKEALNPVVAPVRAKRRA